MKMHHLLIPAAFLLYAAPAHACVQGLFEVVVYGLAIIAGLLGATTLGQVGLMRLRRNHTLSRLGKWTLGGLSMVHLCFGLGVLLLGLSGGGLTGAAIAAVLALPLVLMGWAGLARLS